MNEKIKNDKTKEDSLYASSASKYAVLLSNSIVGLDEAMANAENKNRTKQNERGRERRVQPFHLAVSFLPTLLLSGTSKQMKECNHKQWNKRWKRCCL